MAIALADPSDLDAIDYLAHHLRRDIEVRVASLPQLNEFIQRLYSESKT